MHGAGAQEEGGRKGWTHEHTASAGMDIVWCASYHYERELKDCFVTKMILLRSLYFQSESG